jgi:DNA-binding response OmpR family regulator
VRALIVEDDVRLRGVISRTAARAGLAVDDAMNVRDAEELLDLHEYDLLVLDRMLPDGDGLGICRRARSRGFGNSILVLTALDDSESTIDGLSEGADDYIGKPFDLDVLEAKMKALVRRNQRRPTMVLALGDLTLMPWQRRLVCNGEEIPLTAREFSIMETLMRNADASLSRSELHEQAWGERDEPMSNTIDVLMARVRRKLAASGSRVKIETLRGSGYRLRMDE